jgi:hypothetical protein
MIDCSCTPNATTRVVRIPGNQLNLAPPMLILCESDAACDERKFEEGNSKHDMCKDQVWFARDILGLKR